MENKKLRMLNHQYNDDAIWIGGKDFGTKLMNSYFTALSMLYMYNTCSVMMCTIQYNVQSTVKYRVTGTVICMYHTNIVLVYAD